MTKFLMFTLLFVAMMACVYASQIYEPELEPSISRDGRFLGFRGGYYGGYRGGYRGGYFGGGGFFPRFGYRGGYYRGGFF